MMPPRLSAVAQGDDVDAIEQAIKNVDKQTREFAARRMDQSVRRALKASFQTRFNMPKIVILPHQIFCPDGAVLKLSNR